MSAHAGHLALGTFDDNCPECHPRPTCRCQIIGWTRDPAEPQIAAQPEWEQADDCPVHPLATHELLTQAEHAAIEKAGNLWNDLCALIPEGPSRDADLAELIVHVHAIQHTVMAQAAARAYPGQYRQLGVTIPVRRRSGTEAYFQHLTDTGQTYPPTTQEPTA